MDKIMNYIAQNPVVAIVAAAILMFGAGVAFRKLRSIGLILILIAAFIFYVLLKGDKVGKTKIDEIKQKVKTKVMENI